ncbi:hypothetical protein [Paraburkholderia caribensis]|uniref:hypothetical protein n=1 Tax=Paraburkholderia caribensis TaxID=75105 RepID=UPI0034D3531A
MKALSYTTLTQTTEAVIREHIGAAARDAEAGNGDSARYRRGVASGAFDLWQVLSLQHLDAMARASYAADFARLSGIVSSEQPAT